MNLTDEEKHLLNLLRLHPKSLAKVTAIAKAMIFHATDKEREYAENEAEIMPLLGIKKDRCATNALKKAAAMVILRQSGWTCYKAQRAVGLRCKSAGMCLRSVRLHDDRMMYDAEYRGIFAEVEKRLGEWMKTK